MKSAVIQYFVVVALGGLWSYFSGEDFMQMVTLFLITDIFLDQKRGRSV